jgi:two-component system OmpR family sensor kinase
MLLKNLVDNAIRYTPDGGRIDLSAAAGKDGATLRVEDTGPGIRPEDRERAFDPFHRATQTDGGGSGLGLSIVKAIVDRLGGGICLDESPSGGLAVVVTMPKRLLVSDAAGDFAARA